VRENFSYPIYNSQYEKTLDEARHVFGQYKNLYLLGRAAEFRHREVDDNFAAAIETVREVSRQLLGAEQAVEVSMEAEAKIQSPNVAVVILTYNHYADTQECLESVFKADYENFYVILVDNGSTDGTPERVREDFPRVRVIENNENLGVPAGYNVGFRHALDRQADYILMLNNDTVIPGDLISKLVAQAENNQDIGVVMPKVLYYGTENQVWSSGGQYKAFPPRILMTSRGQENQLRAIEYAPSCALLISARAFELAGLFDPGYFFLYDDWDFSERVRAHGLKILYDPQAYMWHKVSRTTKGPQSPLYWKTYGTSLVRFYRRHGRPVWFSLPLHVGYIILRDFVLKGNWKYWGDFRTGMKDGLQKPLGSLPQAH
jgi:GT2 family glycosyltransferase